MVALISGQAAYEMHPGRVGHRASEECSVEMPASTTLSGALSGQLKTTATEFGPPDHQLSDSSGAHLKSLVE